MSKTTTVRYYPKRELTMGRDESGAEFWAVALERATLTYFVVPPHTRFDTHSHESEQITFVLKGVLYFESAGETIAVGEGEVIALPANAPHAVFTESETVCAVDAWSPPPPNYTAHRLGEE